MKLQEREKVYIQSYKHDGSLHRTWAQGYILEANEKRIVAVTNRAFVSEADGRTWVTREPAICFFYPDKWYNVICMIRKNGVHYYCNLASPSLFDGEAIKNIDYDLDVKILPNGKFSILDEDEYAQHSKQMHYSAKLDHVIRSALDKLLVDIQLKNSPFDAEEIMKLYDKYLYFLEDDEKNKKSKKKELTKGIKV